MQRIQSILDPQDKDKVQYYFYCINQLMLKATSQELHQSVNQQLNINQSVEQTSLLMEILWLIQLKKISELNLTKNQFMRSLSKEQFICTKILNRQDLILRNQKYEANSLLSLKILPTVDSEKASESITTIGLSIAKGISDSKKMNSEKKDLKFYKKGRVKTQLKTQQIQLKIGSPKYDMINEDKEDYLISKIKLNPEIINYISYKKTDSLINKKIVQRLSVLEQKRQKINNRSMVEKKLVTQ